MVACRPAVQPLVNAIRGQGLFAQQGFRQSQHQGLGSPVGHIDVGVEVLLHQFLGGAFEVPPVVDIGKARGRDLGASGEGA